MSKPEGRKYAAAQSWGVATVSVEWLDDSVARGLILDEVKYDPLLPKEERGVGAWVRPGERRVPLGKRPRDAKAAPPEEGRRKLRKVATAKLNSQRDNLWGDILGKQPQDEPAEAGSGQAPANRPAASDESPLDPTNPITQRTASWSMPAAEAGVFQSCVFYVHGFSQARADILADIVTSMGGKVASSLDGMKSEQFEDSQFRILIAPQTSRPETLPDCPDGIYTVTEFYIERCMHKKQFFRPDEQPLGRPFSVFPIPGFERLAICTAGFTGVDLNQVDKTIRQLGASYNERFTAESSLLLVTSLDDVRKQKLDLALLWHVPVVDARWLWECISSGLCVPTKAFLMSPPGPGARRRSPSQDQDRAEDRVPLRRSHSEPNPNVQETPSELAVPRDVLEPRVAPPTPQAAREVTKEKSDATTHFETAPTHLRESRESSRHSAPLSEVSANELNKSASPSRSSKRARTPLSRIVSEIADSESASEYEDVHTVQAPLREEGLDDSRTGSVETERAAAAAAAAAVEKLALSTKLVSLLQATAPVVCGAGSHDSLAARDDDGGPVVATRRNRRKRGILGRAISNVSAGSSASVESYGGTRKSAAAAANFSLGGLLGGGSQAAEPDKPAPSTQLEYEDPDAKRYKEQLMNKMMGTVKAAEGGQVTTPRNIQAAAEPEHTGVAAQRRNLRRR